MLDPTRLVKVVGLLVAAYFLAWPIGAVLTSATHGSVDTLRLVLTGYGSWCFAVLAWVTALSAVRRSRRGRLLASEAIAYRTLGGLLVLMTIFGLSDHPAVVGHPPRWLPALLAATALVVQLVRGVPRDTPAVPGGPS